jgi:VCBS repeat-containing protein
VLGNDTDAEGSALTAALVAGPTKGTLTLNANGSFTYTPNANVNGSDSFTYRANDSSLNSNTATVTITITPVADAPVAANDSYSTNEDTPLNIATPGVLANDTDADGNPITAALVTGPTKGTLTLNANGSFLYTPNPNVNGSDSFTYRANDGSLNSNNATVTITINAVNDPPVAVIDSYNVTQDTPLTVSAPGVLANDTDIEGSALSAVQVTAPANGTLTFNANGGFTYTPAAGYSGTDSFTYKANDGSADSNIVTVTITVASAGLGDTTAANFNAGTIGTCSVVTDSGDGEVILAPAIDAPFSGTSLPAGWSQTSTGGTATVSGGMVNVDGARVYTTSTYGAGRSIEFTATFGAAAGQDAGFGVNLGAGESWLTFGTASSTTTLYARINNAGSNTDTAIAGSWIGAPHTYRIDWSASRVAFMIDGSVVLTQNVAIAGTMRPVISDLNVGGPQLAVDLLRLGPFSGPCTFTSRIFDGGATTTWRNLEAIMRVPDGAMFTFETRSGNTATPDGTWSAWAALSGSSIPSPASRYMQYRVTLSTLTYAEAGGAAIGATPELRQVVINPTHTPLVSINDVTVTETNAAQTMTFTVSLSAATTQPVVVSYATAMGSAISPNDFTAATGTVTIAAGATSQTIAITVAGDTLNEDNEKFFVNLTGATNAFVADPQGVGTINNDDTGTGTIAVGDVSKAEGNSGTSLMNFPVTLSTASGKVVTVNYATSAGSGTAGEDYVTSSGTVTFPAGSTTQYASIVINGDTKYEATEQFFVNLSAAVNATISDSLALGTITNDDTLPQISINDVSVAEGNSGTKLATFTVSLSNPSSASITVKYATADGTATAGSDYVSASGTLTFAAGTTSQTVSVTINGDTAVEANEMFNVNLSAPTNSTIARATGTGTILNDD